MRARSMTKLQKLIIGSEAVKNIIAHLQEVLQAYGPEGFDLMLRMNRNALDVNAKIQIGLENVKFGFLEANAKKILEQFKEGMSTEEARDAFVDIAEIFNSDVRFNQVLQHYHEHDADDSEDLRNFLLAEASCCILETCMSITNKKLFDKWKQSSNQQERSQLKAMLEDSSTMLGNVRRSVEDYKHPETAQKNKKISLRTKKINPMSMGAANQELLAALIHSHPEVKFFDANNPETGKPVKYLVPDPNKNGVFNHVKLTQSLVRYERKNTNGSRFAVCHSTPLGEGGYGVVYESAASLAIKPGTKGRPDRAVVKKKTPEKTRVVKRLYDAEMASREGELLEKVLLLHAKRPTISKDQQRGSLIMRKFNGKELIEHLMADWGDDHNVINRNTFTVDQRLELTIMVAEAIIEQVHENDLIHRDIKGDNVMVELDAHNNPLSAVVIDYGLAKYKGEKTPEHVGTSTPIDYRAPEVKADKEATSDEKSDAYSFATLLREIIWYGVKTGRRYAGLSSQQKENIHKVIQRGIHSNSATRASMQEILDVFKDVSHERKQTPHSGLGHQDDHKRQD